MSDVAQYAVRDRSVPSGLIRNQPPFSARLRGLARTRANARRANNIAAPGRSIACPHRATISFMPN